MFRYCSDCGAENDLDSKFCDSCGIKLLSAGGTQTPPNKSVQASSSILATLQLDVPQPHNSLSKGISTEVISTSAFDTAQIAAYRNANPYRWHAIAILDTTLVAWILLEFVRDSNAPTSGLNYLAWTGLLLTLVPLSCGAVMLLLGYSETPNWMAAFSGWMDRRVVNSYHSSGRFNQFVVKPSLRSYEAFDRHARIIDDGVLRNSAMVATYAFTIILFGLLVFWLTVFILAAVLFIIAIGIAIFAINLSQENSSIGRVSSAVKSGLSPNGEGQIYSGTSFFNEQVTGRVDGDGNIIQGSNFFNEQKVGRIDDDGNRYQGTNFFNEQKVGRTDKDGNIYEGTNFFNEEKVGRVDQEGNIYEGSNLFSEKKVGRIKK